MKSGLRRLGHVCVFVAADFFVALTFLYLREFKSKSASTNNQAPQPHDIATVPVMLGKIDPNRKYAVFSTTSAGNEESRGFIFLLPLTALAWKRIGFNSVVIVVGSLDMWNSDPLLHTVLTSLRKLDVVVIFMNAHPANSVMVSQVRNTSALTLDSSTSRSGRLT